MEQILLDSGDAHQRCKRLGRWIEFCGFDTPKLNNRLKAHPQSFPTWFSFSTLTFSQFSRQPHSAITLIMSSFTHVTKPWVKTGYEKLRTIADGERASSSEDCASEDSSTPSNLPKRNAINFLVVWLCVVTIVLLSFDVYLHYLTKSNNEFHIKTPVPESKCHIIQTLCKAKSSKYLSSSLSSKLQRSGSKNPMLRAMQDGCQRLVVSLTSPTHDSELTKYKPLTDSLVYAILAITASDQASKASVERITD